MWRKFGSIVAMKIFHILYILIQIKLQMHNLNIFCNFSFIWRIKISLAFSLPRRPLLTEEAFEELAFKSRGRWGWGWTRTRCQGAGTRSSGWQLTSSEPSCQQELSSELMYTKTKDGLPTEGLPFKYLQKQFYICAGCLSETAWRSWRNSSLWGWLTSSTPQTERSTSPTNNCKSKCQPSILSRAMFGLQWFCNSLSFNSCRDFFH